MATDAMVTAAVQQASRLLSAQLLRHGGVACESLIADVLRSAAAWLPASGTAALKQLLLPSTTRAAGEDVRLPSTQLSGDQLEAALATLRMLNSRLATLSGMAHEPSSCSRLPDVSVSAQSWLVAHKARQARDYFQFGYALTLTNTAQEPLQLVRKAWTVQDMTGFSRHRESLGICGLQPVIYSSPLRVCSAGLPSHWTAPSMQVCFELKGVRTGRVIQAHVPPFALTPTAAQLSNPPTIIA